MIDSYITDKDYIGLLNACEDYELKYDTLPNPPIPLTQIYTAYLGSYIIADDLHSARFVRKRMLKKVETNHWILEGETENMWQVCAALWKTEYSAAYVILNDSSRWSTRIQPMINDILESIRERVALLLAKAYTTITMDNVISFFGMQEQDIIQALSTKGWTYDPTSSTFTTCKQETANHKPSNFDQLSAMSNIVLHLEKF
ncbi:COP9 signalosome [Chlamydoabsidia padenii]|nr:COP9 signalosome [Chlamydoabsidia padenii]